MALPIASRILHVNTSTLSDCLDCDEVIIGDVGPQHFEAMCNHLIQKHGYRCFHIGQETQETIRVSPGIRRSPFLAGRTPLTQPPAIRARSRCGQ